MNKKLLKNLSCFKKILKIKVTTVLIFLLFSFSVFASDPSPRFLVHLLDYLAQDYIMAVSDGKIINQYEYDEQIDFMNAALEANATLKTSAQITKELEELKKLILSKDKGETVSQLARRIQKEVIEFSKLPVAPEAWPNLTQGKKIFQQNCTQCHGKEGRGDGPLAKGLNPMPPNFLNSDYIKSVSPFKAFNTIRLGVTGTTMSPFVSLSDKDVWNVAFYIISLRHEGKSHGSFSKEDIPLKKVAVSSDEELNRQDIADIRLYTEENDNHRFIYVAKTHLENAKKNYQKGDFKNARKEALMAYLEGVEPIEPRLKASDPHVVLKLEEELALVRNSIELKKSFEEISNHILMANQSIDKASLLLDRKTHSPWFTFSMASGIILREGFEAVLIIIALLGVIRAAGSKRAALWVHGGWLFALVCGFIAWFFSGWVMNISGASRELMEAITSLLAVVVLLYLGFWLHSKTEITRWNHFIHHRIKTALEGSHLLTLGAISFMAVFREAFETVLFLRALWIEEGITSKTALTLGTFGSLILIFILALALLKYSVRIPIRTLFNLSSVIMLILAVILTGKGLHAFQETGLISITSSPFPFRFEFMGFYPTLETLFSQCILMIISIVLWRYTHKASAV